MLGAGLRKVSALWRATAVACVFALAAGSAPGQDAVTLTAQDLSNFGRIILDFPSRIDLPVYRLQAENGVLTIEFDDPLQLVLPDMSGTLSTYITVARLDPDARGLRIGLKGPFQIHPQEAGEKLFIDFLPANWSGVLPGLPADVVAKLSLRAKEAALEAERRRKAEIAANNRPEVKVRVGQHPTFMRLQIDWSVDTRPTFSFTAPQGVLSFDWPIDIDLYEVKAQLPAEILNVTNMVTPDATRIVLTTAPGVEPRFYALSERQFILDVDIEGAEAEGVDLAVLLPEELPRQSLVDQAEVTTEARNELALDQTVITPRVETVGSTVRIVFPFERETPSAVFRRGDMLWMVFDTPAQVQAPASDADLEALAGSFDAVSVGGTSIVRMKLATDRLASLGSEGRAWVLSLGDLLLTASAPIRLSREQDPDGRYYMSADVDEAYRVHQLRDPDVGDVLEVITVLPPARSIARTLDHVDFTALRTVHGLVIRPKHDEVEVLVENEVAVVRAERGLVLSPPRVATQTNGGNVTAERDGFIDLLPFVEPDPSRFHTRREDSMERAANAERSAVDAARMQLARLFLANQLPQESLGVIRVMAQDLVNKDLAREVRLMGAAANVAAGRAGEAIEALSAAEMAGSVDALMWRSIARAEARDFTGARADALAAEPAANSYPAWVHSQFLMAGALAGVETGDAGTSARFLSQVDTARLTFDDLSRYELLSGRLDELEGRLDEALDTYGLVIAMDVRPTRAEAIFLTLSLLDKMRRLDPTRAAETLATEASIWRGDALEAKMLKLLAELFFRGGEYRQAFETVRQAALAHPDDQLVGELTDQAQKVFADLYLNGQADSLDPIQALSLYYDFQHLTPPGARGDEMIRNLARRLIRVDLLGQAADLLAYQVDNRLEGAAKAQIAADLAIIHIANRRPDQALRALSGSRLAGLPPALERQRRILEARALVDANREDLALDLLSSMDGRDADLLRVDAHWRGKRYREAGELLERLYAPARSGDAMTLTARQGIIRAAVAFVLANDAIGLSRLRSKFGERMATTPEWALFDFVTGPINSSSLEFKQVARDVANFDSLNAFLTYYREVYEADGALAPTATQANGQI